MATDIDFAKVFLLTPFDGVSGQTSPLTALRDFSPNTKAVSSFGTPALSLDSPFSGLTSLALNGTTQYLSLVEIPDLSTLGDFTLEGWFKPGSATSGGPVLSCRNAAGSHGYIAQLTYSAGKWTWIWQQWQPGYVDSTAGILGVTAGLGWTFCQLTRVGNVITGYVGGTSGGTYMNATRPTVGTTLPTIFKDSGASSYFSGNCFDLRLTIGGSRSTAIPTSPFPRGIKEVTGIVRDSTGTPTSRVVRSYSRSTGVLLDATVSNATTGVYSLSAPSTEEVVVVCLDDTAGVVQNDLVKRAIPA